MTPSVRSARRGSGGRAARGIKRSGGARRASVLRERVRAARRTATAVWGLAEEGLYTCR